MAQYWIVTKAICLSIIIIVPFCLGFLLRSLIISFHNGMDYADDLYAPILKEIDNHDRR